jgi:hypothetical protein
MGLCTEPTGRVPLLYRPSHVPSEVYTVVQQWDCAVCCECGEILLSPLPLLQSPKLPYC